MAKADIHPKMTTLVVTLSNGEKYETRWTGSEQVLSVHSDPTNHPAWTRDFGVVQDSGRSARFNDKFGR